MTPRVGFPPATHHVEMPASGRRAQRASLALFAATEPSQRLALAGVRVLITLGATAALRVAPVTPPLPAQQWDAWLNDTAAAEVGPVADVAWYVGRPDRLAGLLLGPNGAPLAFAKFHWGSWVPGEDEAAATRALSDAPRSFSVPVRLAEGHVDGVHWQLDAPLPEGPHRRPPFDRRRLVAVFDELRERLDGVARPAATADDHVLTHADFTPRNLRQTADGRLWLLDWEGAEWGPRAVDEVTYLTVDRATRIGHRPRRDAQRIAALLAPRHRAGEIAAAVSWLRTRMGPDTAAVRGALEALVTRGG